MQSNGPQNHRRWEREPATIPISLVLKAEKFKSDTLASTLNVSLSGVSVRTTLSLVPGDWVGIVPQGEFPHAIPARVAWVQEEPSHWIIAGLDFLTAPES